MSGELREGFDIKHIFCASMLLDPPPVQYFSVFKEHRSFNYFSMCISIDSKWSKTYDFMIKISIKLNPSKIHIFTFQNILHLFLG